jgi:hypothetical protein
MTGAPFHRRPPVPPARLANGGAPLLAAVIFKSHAVHAFVESVNARPGEGPTGAFAFGRRVKDDGRAKSALIAVAGLMRKGRG